MANGILQSWLGRGGVGRGMVPAVSRSSASRAECYGQRTGRDRQYAGCRAQPPASLESGFKKRELLADFGDVSHVLLGIVLFHFVDADISGAGPWVFAATNEVLGHAAVHNWRLREFVWRMAQRQSGDPYRPEMGAPLGGRRRIAARWRAIDGNGFYAEQRSRGNFPGVQLRLPRLHAPRVLGRLHGRRRKALRWHLRFHEYGRTGGIVSFVGSLWLCGP